MSNEPFYEPLLDIENVLKILNRIAIFAGLNDKQLYKLFRILQKVSYRRGQVIFEEGSEPSHIYIVREGAVKLYVGTDSEPLEIYEFGPGQCFGETAVIGVLKQTATAIAASATDLIVLSRSALLEIYKSDLEMFSILILNIAREACRRLHMADETLLHYFHRK